MTLDLLIPFGILLILVIYLIYTRTMFEKQTIKEYEEKFENWKVHAKPEEKKESKKELVGLVFKKDGKIDIELFDEFSNDRIQKGKFNSKIRE
ncbi:hypothetical protein [Arcobacter sp.]|uniref:hypothetical protein n=2 Tax=Arcobacter sp. TaxID=1872629 RepID=UPI003D152CC6